VCSRDVNCASGQNGWCHSCVVWVQKGGYVKRIGLKAALRFEIVKCWWFAVCVGVVYGVCGWFVLLGGCVTVWSTAKCRSGPRGFYRRSARDLFFISGCSDVSVDSAKVNLVHIVAYWTGSCAAWGRQQQEKGRVCVRACASNSLQAADNCMYCIYRYTFVLPCSVYPSRFRSQTHGNYFSYFITTVNADLHFCTNWRPDHDLLRDRNMSPF